MATKKGKKKAAGKDGAKTAVLEAMNSAVRHRYKLKRCELFLSRLEE
jgi:hypothetical protein